MKILQPYEELFGTYPMLRIVCPLVVGIVLGDSFYEEFSGYAFAFVIAASLMAIVQCMVYKRKQEHSKKYYPFYGALSVGVACLGVALLLHERADLQVEWSGTKQNYRMLLLTSPKEGRKTWKAEAAIVDGPYAGNNVGLTLMKAESGNTQRTKRSGMEGNVDEVMQAGDVILCHTRIEKLRNSGNPSEFDYAQWQERQGMSGSAFCFPGQWKVSEYAAKDLPWQVRFLRWRSQLVARYAAHIEGRALSILQAMTLGDRSRLDAATREIFSNTGVSHVLALSGLHLSILFVLYQTFILRFVRKRYGVILMSLIGVGGLWLFALLAGMPLSLVRAAIMFTIMQAVSFFHRENSSVNNLAIAALIVLLWSPQSLFDVGFQLSCLSVFSIVLFGTSIPSPKWVNRFKVARWLYGMLAVSFCAQLGTAPLVAYYFHTFPTVGFLANLVAVPMAYFILGVACLFFLFPFLQSAMAVMLDWALRILEVSLVGLSRLPYATLHWHPSVCALLIAYILIAVGVIYWVNRRSWQLYVFVSGFALLLGLEFYQHRPNRLLPQLICYNVGSVPAIHVIASAERSYLWSSNFARMDSALLSVKKSFWKEEGIVNPMMLKQPYHKGDIYYEAPILYFRGCRIVVLCERLSKGKPTRPLAVDYLVLSRGVRAPLSEILDYYQPRMVILDASLSDYHTEQYLNACSRAGISVHVIEKHGALRVNL